MAQRISGYARQANETYETPAWCAQIVADGYLRGHCKHVWDPADGPSSRLAVALQAQGFTVTATADNFLAKRAPPDPSIEASVMNPPYGWNGRLAHRFIAHALNLTPIVAALLKIDFDSGKTRSPLFADCPHFVGKIVLLDRITWFEPAIASPSENHAWFLWHRQHQGPPTIRYARRPR
jgi:hypothetical protein